MVSRESCNPEVDRPMTEGVILMVCRRALGRMVALLPLVALPACWDTEPTAPPEPVDPELVYAMLPAALFPDELVVQRGDVIVVLGAIPPNVTWHHQVNFSNHFLIQCATDDDYVGYWPPCSVAISEGYVIIEGDVGRFLSSIGCTARLNYVPGDGINPSVSHCDVPTDYTIGQGAGVEWVDGAWTVTGCDPAWITYRHTGSAENTPANSAAITALSDTTRITVAQPCADTEAPMGDGLPRSAR